MNDSVAQSWTGSAMKYILIMVLTSILWSSGGILIKLVSISSFAVSGLRSLIAAAVEIFLNHARVQNITHTN